jgi:hypothetical protein
VSEEGVHKVDPEGSREKVPAFSYDSSGTLERGTSGTLLR